MLCEELMKCEVETFREHDRVDAIARRMREVNIGFAPICDADGRPVGTLTDRDIALRVCAEDRRGSETLARDVMTREVIACRETDSVERAEEAMALHRKSRIMVLNEHGRLTGVISLSDVVEEEEDDLRAVDTVRHVVDRETHA